MVSITLQYPYHPAPEFSTSIIMAVRPTAAVVFRRHYDQLAGGITNPDRLASLLYAKGLISTGIRDEVLIQGVPRTQKVVKILNAVEAMLHIQHKPAIALKEFCRAVKNQPALKSLTKTIRSELALGDAERSDLESSSSEEEVLLREHDEKSDSGDLTTHPTGHRLFPSPSKVKRTFRRQYSDLAQAIQHPESLACDLYSKELISKATHLDILTNKGYSTEQKAACLLNEVEVGLEMSNKPHEHLRKFCSIIKSYPAIKPLAEKMKAVLGIDYEDDDQPLQIPPEWFGPARQTSLEVIPETDTDVLHKLNPSHFQADIKYYSEQHHPGTREWLFDQVIQWHKKEPAYRGQSKICLITGNPGMGKSVAAAKLCTKGEEERSLAGCFFFQHHKSHRSNPKMLIQTLVYQFCSRIPQYNAKVTNVLESIDLVATSVSELFTYLILEPLSRLPEGRTKKYIVIDALDECNFESRSELLNLIVREFVKLPRWISIVLTSRPDQKILQKLVKIKPVIELIPNDPHNVNDIKAFLSDILKERLSPKEFDAGVALLVKKSEGMFLYFHYSIDTLLTQQSLTLSDLETLLPDGIDDYYDQNFQRLYTTLGKRKYQTLLQAVIAARTDLPKGLVAPLLEISQSDAAQLISTASVLLPVLNNHIHLFHKTIRDWLTDRQLAGECLVDSFAGHGHLATLSHAILAEAKANQEKIAELSSNPVKRYAVENVVYHLSNSNQQTLHRKLLAILEDLHFMYYRLHLSDGSTEDLLADCTEAKEVLKENPQLLRRVEDCSAFVQRYAHILAILPHLVFQCALNESDVFSKRVGISQFLADPTKTFPEMKAFLEVTNKSKSSHSALLTYTCDDNITGCAMTLEEDVILCSDFNGKIYFWKKQTAELLREEETSNHQVSMLSVSPDGKLVAYGNVNEAIEITGGAVPMIGGADSDATSCIFSPDGKKLLAWSFYVDGIFRLMQEVGMNFKTKFTVELWDLMANTCNKLEITTRKENRPISACFSHDGKFINCGHRDGRIIQWESSTGKPTAILNTDGSTTRSGSEPLVLREPPPNDDPIYHIAYSPNGHYFAAICNRGILIWDAAALSLLQLVPLEQTMVDERRPPRYMSCAFSADSQHLVAGTSNGYLKTWSLRSSIKSFTQEIFIRPDGSSNAITRSMFDKQLHIICVIESSIHIYNHEHLLQSTRMQQTETLAAHPGNATMSAFLPDGERAVTCGNDHLFLWHVPTNSLLAAAQGIVDGYLMRLSASGNFLLTYGKGGYIQVWNTDHVNRRTTLCYEKQGSTCVQSSDPDSSSPDDICHCAVSNQGLVVGGTGDGLLCLWHGQDYQFVKTLNVHDALITFLTFSPCDQYFVSADMDGKIMLWQVISAGDQLEVNKIPLASHDDSIEQVVFSYGHVKRIVTCSNDSSLHLYSTPSGDLIKTMKGHTSDVLKVAVSADGSLIASGDELGIIIVWDAFTGELLKHLPAHANPILDLCFTCDDKYICSQRKQKAVFVYEVATGSLVTCLSFRTLICSMSASLHSSSKQPYLICGLKDNSVKFVQLHTIEDKKQ